MTPRAEVYEIIDGERDYQDQHTLRNAIGCPAGECNGPSAPPFTTGEYIVMLQQYAGQLTPAWALEPGDAPIGVLNNMRKIAAIAVQCMEYHGAPPREIERLGTWGQRSEKEKAKNDDNT